jgi:hypothetical protein
MAVLGATPSLPRVPAKVLSPSHLRTLLIVLDLMTGDKKQIVFHVL